MLEVCNSISANAIENFPYNRCRAGPPAMLIIMDNYDS
jgi:hypothetical protein